MTPPLTSVEDPQRLRVLVDAILGVGSDLSLPDTLRRITEAARKVVHARYAALGVLDEKHHHLTEFVTSGMDDQMVRELGDFPEGRGILGKLIVDQKPLRLDDITKDPDSFGMPAKHPRMHSFLGVPVRVGEEVYGNLYLTEKEGGERFTEEDEALLKMLATAAGVAIQNARLHERVGRLTLEQDRGRIAADLHDTVIQRLFAVGLALQSTVKLLPDSLARTRVERAVRELDVTISEIRSTIFALEQTPDETGLRGEITSLVAELTPTLANPPRLKMVGPIDSAVSGVLGSNVLAVLREALTNVARHAHATDVVVEVAAEAGQLRLTVSDNGVGPGAGKRHRGKGVGNIAQRAATFGGTSELRPGTASGSVLDWCVPL